MHACGEYTDDRLVRAFFEAIDEGVGGVARDQESVVGGKEGQDRGPGMLGR